jgi:hypothetical protein
VNYTALGDGVRIPGGWQLTGQIFPQNQSLFIRARGFYPGGRADGSPTFTETVRHVFRPPNVVLSAAASRKTHGTAGTFDVNLSIGHTPSIECRRGTGANNGDHTIVFTFLNTLSSVGSAVVTDGTGHVSSSNIGNDRHQYIVNLADVIDQQIVTVFLSDVYDSNLNYSQFVSVSMGLLFGDTTGSGGVNASDISQVKSQSGQTLSAANCREDVTVSGAINASDIAAVKSRSGTGMRQPNEQSFQKVQAR